jgi:hypothetical protein
VPAFGAVSGASPEFQDDQIPYAAFFEYLPKSTAVRLLGASLGCPWALVLSHFIPVSFPPHWPGNQGHGCTIGTAKKTTWNLYLPGSGLDFSKGLTVDIDTWLAAGGQFTLTT